MLRKISAGFEKSIVPICPLQQASGMPTHNLSTVAEMPQANLKAVLEQSIDQEKHRLKKHG